MTKQYSRREFLKKSAVGAAGVAAMGLLGACSNEGTKGQEKTISFDRETEVIVVGAGGAGLAAAVSASENGAQVLVLEKAAMAGGTTNFSGGVIQAAGTSYQKELTAYQEDTPEKHAQLWIKAGEGAVDEELVQDLAYGAPDNIEWLAQMGLKWTSIYGHCHIPYVTEDLMADRIHVYEGGGASGSGTIMTQALLKTAEANGAVIEYETEVTSLIQEASGKVVGVVANGKNIKASKGVILACAGIDHNQQLAKDLHPQQNWNLEKGTCICAATDTGDGIRMGQIAGAALSGLGGCIDFCGVTGNATDNRVPTFPCFIVNNKGRRFVCEDATYAYHYRAIFQQEKQLDGPTYMIFGTNSLMVDAAVASGYAPWTSETIADAVASGAVIEGATIEELAQKLNIPAVNLNTTLNTWNTNAASGEDPEYNRLTGIEPLTGPYYAYQNVPCNLGAIGGLKINVDCQVISTSGTVIEGLFAAGLNAGGWIGQYYPGSGTAIAGIIHQGRKAGKHCAAK